MANGNRCCTMPNGKHDTVTFRCGNCGIVKWQTDGKVIPVYIGNVLIGARMVCTSE